MRTLLMSMFVLCFPFPGVASELPVLPRDAHSDWEAIGRINTAGYRKREMCTGVLVAPNEVLTAAHCVAGRTGTGPAPEEFTFVAGWLQGEAVDAVKAKSIWVHPKAYIAGKLDLRHDIARITLERDSTVTPLEIVVEPVEAPFAIVGYSMKRPHMLSAAFDCNGASISTVLQLDCPVTPGHSGGPVLAKDGETWGVAAIVSAMGKAGAIAVPVSRLTSK